MKESAHTPMFFEDLTDVSLKFLGSLDLPNEPMSISTIDTSFRDRLSEVGELWLEQLPAVVRPLDDSSAARPSSVGLNTIGVLSDRLTILLIGFCKSRSPIPFQDNKLIMEIVRALTEARPGFSSISTKQTTIRNPVDFDGFQAAFLELLQTNLVLWEAQEILYNRQIDELPDGELRGYIKLFSKDNILRNTLIETVDRLYWSNNSNQSG